MWSETVGLRKRPVSVQKNGFHLGLAPCGLGHSRAGLVLCCETRSCYACRHNDHEGHGNFSNTIYILYLEHHYCEDQKWRLLTQNLFRQVQSEYRRLIFTYCNTASATLFVIYSLGLGLSLKNAVLFTSLIKNTFKTGSFLPDVLSKQRAQAAALHTGRLTPCSLLTCHDSTTTFSFCLTSLFFSRIPQDRLGPIGL